MQDTPHAPPAGRRRLIVKVLLAVAITGAAVGFLLAMLDVDQAWTVLRQADPGWLGFAAALLIVVFVLRSIRLAVAVRQKLRFIIFHVMAVFVFLVALLPGKIGELSLPYLLKRRLDVRLSFGVGALILLRAYDLLLLVLVGCTLLILYQDTFGLPAAAGWAAVFGAVTAAVAAVALPTMARTLVVMAPAALRRRQRVMSIFEGLLAATTSLTWVRLVVLVLLTAGLWLLLFTAFHGVSLALGATPGWPQSVLAVVAASFAFALPINGVANVGPFHLAWVAVMVPLGVPIERAAAAAFSAHILMLIVNAVNAGATSLIDAGLRARPALPARASPPG
ncbi:MAG: hypothetical protein EA406_01465 [Rhodospirillales bacterium]|nr:MAG: hypothetical protein EA406_01465 [Rhodospirillales bacterium]